MLKLLRNKSGLIIALILAITVFNKTSVACTRVLLAMPGQLVLVGNNMDWFEDMKTKLIVYPEGIERNGMTSGTVMQWKAKYGSIVATAYDETTTFDISTNGMNEAGLAAHLLGLKNSDYGARKKEVPGLAIILWAQYYLDNFKSVAEAVRFTERNPFQIVSFIHSKAGQIDLHLALEDATGDSAIIEYMDGSQRIYHNSEYNVVTNEPAFDQQLVNLKQYAGFGGDEPLPGTTLPRDRFVRATYYSAHLSGSKSTREAVLKLMSVMQNAGQPYGTLAPERNEDGRIFESLWRTVSDLTHRVYYFNSTMSFNTIWVRLDGFNLKPGAKSRVLDLSTRNDLVGDVTDEFSK